MSHILVRVFLLKVVVLLTSFIPVQAQSVNHVWSKGLGGSSSEMAYSITARHPGYLYVGGSFSGTVDFDPGPGVVNLTSDGGNDGFVLKLDTAGVLIWAKKIGGTLTQTVYSIDVDSLGGVYITGGFTGASDLDPGFGSQMVVSNGSDDIFILHLDSAGNYVWGKSIGGPERDNGNAIVIDSLGNAYVTGTYGSNFDADPGPGSVNLTFHGSTATQTDVFLAKFDINGSLMWANGIGGAAFDTCRSLTLDDQLNVIIAGGFVGPVDFDPGPGVFMMTSAASNSSNTFIVKFNSAGSLVWAKEIGGNSFNPAGSVLGLSLGSDNLGNILITGRVTGLVDFDPGPGAYSINGNGSADLFVTKLDGLGNFLWAKRIGGLDFDFVYSIQVDGSGNTYVSGSTRSYQVDFDPGPSFYRVSNNTSDQTFFIFKLSGAGDFFWARMFGGSSSTGSNCWSALSLDRLSNIYLAGYFAHNSPLDFDPGPGTSTLTNLGEYDIYVVKLAQGNCGLPVNSTSFAGICDSITINNSTYTQTGSYTVLFESQGGCDSISNLVLSINQSSSSTLSIIACDSFSFNGEVYTTGGLHLDTITNVFGCDSVVTLQLNLLHSSADTMVYSACDSFVLNGINYFNSGYYIQNYSGVNGCDSIVVLDLDIMNQRDTFHQSSCDSFVFNGISHTLSGFYEHTFTSVSSCDSVVVLDLDLTTVDVTITNLGTQLFATATGASYQWLDCNGLVPIPSETGPSFTFVQQGSYAVAVTQNGCTDTSVCLVVSDIKELIDDLDINIYPNPSDGNLTVEVNYPMRDAVIRIMDINGCVVQSVSKVQGKKVLLGIESLSSGLYVIEIEDVNCIRRSKFSKL